MLDTNLKNTILYSDVIIKLIATGKVMAIYLGGSRLFNLDIPESDYDIIVIAKDTSLHNYQKEVISIAGYYIHITIHSIKEVIKLIKNPLSLDGFQSSLALIDAWYCPEDCFIWKNTSTRVEDTYAYFQEVIKAYREPLTVLCLETRLNAIYNTLPTEKPNYRPRYYHYLFTYYLLHNYLDTKNLGLSEDQIAILKSFKVSKTMLPAFFESLKNRYPHKYFVPKYKSAYTEAYNQVKHYE